jgi:hypothetical protein
LVCLFSFRITLPLCTVVLCCTPVAAEKPIGLRDTELQAAQRWALTDKAHQKTPNYATAKPQLLHLSK